MITEKVDHFKSHCEVINVTASNIMIESGLQKQFPRMLMLSSSDSFSSDEQKKSERLSQKDSIKHLTTVDLEEDLREKDLNYNQESNKVDNLDDNKIESQVDKQIDDQIDIKDDIQDVSKHSDNKLDIKATVSEHSDAPIDDKSSYAPDQLAPYDQSVTISFV